jgi:hypothetical protein
MLILPIFNIYSVHSENFLYKFKLYKIASLIEIISNEM